MKKKPIVSFRDVSFWYPGSDSAALRGVSLNVYPSEFMLVVGSSGSGKSTFLRCINGLVPHFSGGRFKGSVSVCGLDTKKNRVRDLAEHVGFVFQDPENQFIMSSVESELAFGLENRRLTRNQIKDAIDEVSQIFGLEEFLSRRVTDVSSGEKQKIVLASVLAAKPRVLVLDEPTSQLDPVSAREFLCFLKDMSRRLSLTVVLAEHRLDRVSGFADRVFDLDSGLAGPPEDILPNTSAAPPTLKLAARLREKNIDIGKPLSIKQARDALEKHRHMFKETKKQEKKQAQDIVAVIKDLDKSFNGDKILKNANLTLFRGEFLALLGRNGAGKTTLVKHLNGLLSPDSGKVTVLGADVSEKTVDEMAHQVGFVSQNPNDYLFSETVLAELSFTAENLGVNADIESLLDYVGLTKHKNTYPRDLSCGERQKVAIASILVGNPQIIIFDEPTRGMDAQSKENLSSLLAKLKSSGKTILFVTHDVETAAASADRVAIIEHGTVTCQGPPRDILPNNKTFQPQISQLFPDKKYITVNDALEALN
ncbi:MAG: energy-coupling factor transporter ATPase [Candidatus Altiarchaeota archaeon]